MSLFLTPSEVESLKNLPANSPTADLLSAMQLRVRLRASSPSLTDPSATTDWWHHVAEYLTDAALVHALRPAPAIASWLRSVVLAIVRRPPADWAGPPFRGYTGGDPVGTLETSHLTWSLAVALDLASDLFSPSEFNEVASALRLHGLGPCRRYLATTNFCHNWNCVLLAGVAVAAAVLDDHDALADAIAWFPLAADHFQPDGSYGESLQYANYAAYSLILAREALLRRSPSQQLTLEPYARIAHWATHALFYRKPLSGWGEIPRARSANFGDSAALFRPSGDLLLHIAVHARHSLPTESGLARWLFDTLYFPPDEPPPHDLASFGFLPGFGFLSVLLMPRAASPISPIVANLPLLAPFSAGDVFARDSWDGLTILAARTPSQPRHATAHIHGDINSFILVHRNERLLLDPGHSCYRNLNHDLEAASLTHNTCTFEIPASPSSPSRTLTQRGGINRPILRDQTPPRGSSPIDLGGRRLLCTQLGPVSVIASEAAPLYGPPLRSFTRLWVLCGAHALFLIDHIESDVPLRATWHFLLNNRDGLLDLQLHRPNRITAQRGNAALQLNHFNGGNMTGPLYAYVHDAYHPLPAQRGEGRSGSGQLIRWTETHAAETRTAVHALCFDKPSEMANWSIQRDRDTYSISAPAQQWILQIEAAGSHLSLQETQSRQAYSLAKMSDGTWSLSPST